MGSGTPIEQGAPALSPDADPQSNLPLENLSLTAPPPGQEFNTPGEGFVTQTASELGIPDFDRGEFIFNPDLGGSEAQQRELFEFSADTFVPIFRDIAPRPPQGDDIIFDAFDPPTPTPAPPPPPPPPPQTAEQRRQDDILVQLGKLGSNLNRVQAAEERRQQRQTRDEIPNLDQNTSNPLAQVPESVIATLLNLGEQNNLGGVQVAERESKRFPSQSSSNVNTRFISKESAQKFADQAREQARLRQVFGRNPTGIETLRFNNPTFDKILRGFGVDPLFIGNQTRVIDGQLTPVPVRIGRAEGGLVAPPQGLAATPEGEESFSFGFSLDDVNDYVNRVISGDIVSENLRNMFSPSPYSQVESILLPFAKANEGFISKMDTAIEDKGKSNPSMDIGHGHKLTPEELKTKKVHGIDISEGITKDEADIIYRKDLKQKYNLASEQVPGFKNLTPREQALITDFQFNVKGGAKTYKKMLKAIKEKDFETLNKEYKRNMIVETPDGKKLKKPLTKRNKDTYSTFIVPLMEQYKELRKIGTI